MTRHSLIPQRGMALALCSLLIALLFVPAVLAADAEHQLVRGVRATFTADGSTLKVSLALQNGDVVEKRYKDPEEVERVTRLLQLALHKNVSLLATVKNDRIKTLFVEFGTPAPYEVRD